LSIIILLTIGPRLHLQLPIQIPGSMITIGHMIHGIIIHHIDGRITIGIRHIITIHIMVITTATIGVM